MTASDKNRKTKRANKMLAVTKAVEIKWAAKAETLSWKQKAAKAKAGQRQSSWGRADVIVLLELLPLMFSENLHIMIRADTKLKQKVGERERERKRRLWMTSAPGKGPAEISSDFHFVDSPAPAPAPAPAPTSTLAAWAAVYWCYEIFKCPASCHPCANTPPCKRAL